MKLRYKVLGTFATVLVVAVATLAVAMSHDSPCTAAPPPAANTPLMKAIVYRCYGPPTVLKLEDIAKPIPADDRVLVKVHAASVNPLDWHYMQGKPYIMRPGAGFGKPTSIHMGADFAGTVEAVGKNVTRFKAGDEVFGDRDGAFAQYVSVSENGAMAIKPTNMTMEQAAAVPVAGITALQALRDKGKIQAGQKVLINGASGGVGTFAVQIAKVYGAEVTGVCSGRNAAMVSSLGADHVIDYTKEDFTHGSARYDLIIDNVGNHSLSEYRQVLNSNGTLIVVGGTERQLLARADNDLAEGLFRLALRQPKNVFHAGAGQQGRSRPAARSDADRKGNTGHRQALPAERDAGRHRIS